jgi:hypothetical protein
MPKIRTNETKLIRIAVQGRVANAAQFAEFEVAHDGKPFALPSTGGIVYNVKTGDAAFGWEGDHIEPGVSVILDEEKRSSRANMGFNFLACVGNTARIVSGAAKGQKGIVTGHHGGVEHVTIDFDEDTLYKLTVDDKILIEGFGQGLKMTDYSDVRIFNLDPDVLHKMPLRPVGNKIEIGVTTIVPAELMGSGMGHNNIGTGDCDIMTHDPGMVKQFKLDKMCLGDFVAVLNHDHTFGRTYRKGAVTIGIVVHSNSTLPGHGPGISTLLTSASGQLKPVINPRANLARILGIGRFPR